MNKVRVNICGKEYSLTTEESQGYVSMLAAKLEESITELLNSSSSVSLQAATIVTALSLMDETVKLNESIDNIRTQIKEYVDDAARARVERDDMLHFAEELSAKVQKLESENKLLRLKDEIPSKKEKDKEKAAQ